MQSARTITLEYVFFELHPFEISSSATKLCPLYNFTTLDDMQSAKTITLVLILFEVHPFELCK